MENKDITAQFEQAGIFPFYWGEQGQTFASDEVKKGVLSAFEGRFPPYINNDILPTVNVSQASHDIYLCLQQPLNSGGDWQLVLEDGTVFAGRVENNSVHLPANLPLGYHQLILNANGTQHNTTVIITPTSCYQPESVQHKERLWGSFIQLYTLKSATNWGVGDFGDLRLFIDKFQHSGADFIGLNPIHALFPANPESASPYSPSSRTWMNIIYIDINTLPEFQSSEKAQQWFNSSVVQKKLMKLRDADWIDYSAVMSLKLQALKMAYHALTAQSIAHQETFRDFKKRHGERLLVQASYDALQDHMNAQKSGQYGWQEWESKYQDYHATAVKQFQEKHAALVDFYCWLQWIADEQLAECQKLCEAAGMKIGLYRDLAVGVTPNSAETWYDKALYCLQASVGAPPDMLGPQGQNWGLSPMNPHVLRQQAYQPFINMLRANMQHCGALRIDHIMGLMRLWWIKSGDQAVNGAYVGYPVDDMLAILALESQRHHCLIIGEDLGTVPGEIIQKLHDAAILSYKLFYFEFDEQGRSRALNRYPYQAMTALSTHDLPTINGYWRGEDFRLGEKFDIYPSAMVMEILKAGRVDAKRKFLQRMQESGIPIDEAINAGLQSPVTKQFNYQLQCYVANVSTALFGLQPEDWLNMSEPVNIPGTSSEYPNWRCRLSATIDEIFEDQEITTLLTEVNRIRKG